MADPTTHRCNSATPCHRCQASELIRLAKAAQVSVALHSGAIGDPLLASLEKLIRKWEEEVGVYRRETWEPE